MESLRSQHVADPFVLDNINSYKTYYYKYLLNFCPILTRCIDSKLHEKGNFN